MPRISGRSVDSAVQVLLRRTPRIRQMPGPRAPPKFKKSGASRERGRGICSCHIPYFSGQYPRKFFKRWEERKQREKRKEEGGNKKEGKIEKLCQILDSWFLYKMVVKNTLRMREKNNTSLKMISNLMM